MTDLCPVAVEATHWKGPQPNTVAEANLRLLKQKRLCDVVFKFENSTTQIEAHQFCLRARSPVFDSKFRGRGSFGERKEIQIITDTTPARFQEFLEFIYADKFQANFSGALDLLRLACQYKVVPLITKCKTVLENGMQADNAVEVFQTAHKLGDLDDLKVKAMDIMASSLNTLCSDQQFLNDVRAEALTLLLKREDLPVKEVDLFKLVVRWGRQRLQTEAAADNNEALKETLAPVLPLVRYCTMSAEDFTEIVVPAQLLTPEEVIDIYAHLCGPPAVR